VEDGLRTHGQVNGCGGDDCRCEKPWEEEGGDTRELDDDEDVGVEVGFGIEEALYWCSRRYRARRPMKEPRIEKEGRQQNWRFKGDPSL